ncbi:MAG: ABC transporter substrate-binding protein [Chitinivibrionales bacterium]|nr:ABC transporter substrate-binding protein [Chitinivibrionales bacterium]MBD3395539.1 ABC transporter substrate-binding protein [Chitinivibrionales bacterium]
MPAIWMHYKGVPSRAAVLLALLVACGGHTGSRKDSIIPQRIVSLAPSITETLFALGLGDKVVGVTRYCRYPPRADSIEEVGGYVDANLEKILSLKPDLVILQEEHVKQRSFLSRYDIRTLAVGYATTGAICSSFIAVGRTCGAKEQADSLVELFASLLRADTTRANRPRMLLCVGRESPGGGAVQSVFAAGAGTFYDNLLLAAGGRNAFADTVPPYPKISREGLIGLAPDIIIDVAPAMGDYACSTLVKDWQSVVMVPAVDRGNVYCLAEAYATVPGPRVPMLLDDFKRIVADAGY